MTQRFLGQQEARRSWWSTCYPCASVLSVAVKRSRAGEKHHVIQIRPRDARLSRSVYLQLERARSECDLVGAVPLAVSAERLEMAPTTVNPSGWKLNRYDLNQVKSLCAQFKCVGC